VTGVPIAANYQASDGEPGVSVKLLY